MLQSRDEIRQTYLNVWQKMQSRSVLEPMESIIADVIRLPEVNFKTNSDVLLTGIGSRLQRAAATLNRYPDLQIEVAGLTDSDGSGLANFSLSERRAKTVRDYLIQYGVDEERLTATGYGESQPIADNTSANGKAANRRVELRIVNR